MKPDTLTGNIDKDKLNDGKWLVDTFQVKVYNVCYSLVHNKQDAEDLTQDVFMEVLKNAGTFRGDSQPGTWIYRIAVNRSLNHIRSAKRRRWLTFVDEVLSFSKESGNEPVFNADPLVDNEQAMLLRKAIDALPEKYRIAFTLNKINEMSYKEVAEIMGISHASVETLIHRAKLKLQAALSNYFR